MDDVVIRPATAGDAEAIQRIYNHEVEHTTHTFDLVPRTLEDQRAWLRDREGRPRGGGGRGRRRGDRLRLAQRVPATGRLPDLGGVQRGDVTSRCEAGGGPLLMQELVVVAEARGFHTMIARITGGQEASIRLHQAVGFTTVGTEREVGRKFGGWLDVVVVQRMLG